MALVIAYWTHPLQLFCFFIHLTFPVKVPTSTSWCFGRCKIFEWRVQWSIKSQIHAIWYFIVLLIVSGLQPGHYSSLTAPYLQHTANQERNDQCGNQHHSRELLMMGIVMFETCWAYKKYNKISSGIYLFFFSSVITMMHGTINVRRVQCLQHANVLWQKGTLKRKTLSYKFNREFLER